MELTVEDIKGRIIIKLVKWKKWGGSHTENIISGMPSHLTGAKITKQALKELVNLELIVSNFRLIHPILFL